MLEKVAKTFVKNKNSQVKNKGHHLIFKSYKLKHFNHFNASKLEATSK